MCNINAADGRFFKNTAGGDEREGAVPNRNYANARVHCREKPLMKCSCGG